jgi:hypothetical protein
MTQRSQEGLSKISRKLSLILGNGACEWKATIQYTDAGFPSDAVFHNTIIAGYPSGDKRVAFQQLEGLTGLSASDEWDFKIFGRPISPSSRPTTCTTKVFGAGEMLVTIFYWSWVISERL